jgi:hypothetical protein
VTGYDFAGDDYDPSIPNSHPQPKPDFMDCDGHGTHVAVRPPRIIPLNFGLIKSLIQGIIAAEPGNPYNISGVAYGATLAAYKVFGCNDGGTTDEGRFSTSHTLVLVG